MANLPYFRERTDAGEKLAELVFAAFHKLSTSSQPRPIVYALPRGGLPVAVPIARRLNCPLSVIIAKKIVYQENPELAIGACTPEGELVWATGLSKPIDLETAIAFEQAQQKARSQLQEFLPFLPPVNPQGSVAIIVDDGIATGMTIKVAAKAMRHQQPAQLWIAAPLAPPDIAVKLRQFADQVFVLETPYPFFSVSRFYQKFPQVEMPVAIACLQNNQAWLESL